MGKEACELEMALLVLSELVSLFRPRLCSFPGPC